MALATLDDLEAQGGPIDDVARAIALLEGASAAVTQLAGCSFERTQHAVEIWPTDCRFAIHGKNVTDLTITDENGDPVTIRKIGPGLWETRSAGPLTATYTEGWDTIPQAITSVVASMTLRALSTSPDQLNVTQQNDLVGPFQFGQSFGTSGATSVGMLPAERDIVLSFRRKPKGILMGVWA